MDGDAGTVGRFEAVLASVDVLDGHREAAARELVAAMAYVVLARRNATPEQTAATREHLAALAAAALVPTAALRTLAERARSWFTRPTPLVWILTEAESPWLDTYLALFREAVTAAGQLEPADAASLHAALALATSQDTPLTAAPPVVPAPPASAGGTPPAAGPRPPTAADFPAGTTSTTTDGPSSSGAPAPADPPETLADLYAELDALVGLDTVKREIRQQAELLRIQHLRQQADLAEPPITRHLVFTGNPGTGKTTVARLVARIYRAVGVLPTGHLTEVDKAGLVAGYVGQSEEKTTKVLAAADGGVLFIDEAYSLTGDDFGESVIDLLVKAAEDRRETLVIILAGYTGPMAEFLEANPGLESRFGTVIEFPDYTDEQLLTIFERLVEKSDYEAGPDVLAAMRERIAAQVRDESFGNARFVRNCFEAAIVNHAWRLRAIAQPTRDDLVTLTPADLDDEATP